MAAAISMQDPQKSFVDAFCSGVLETLSVQCRTPCTLQAINRKPKLSAGKIAVAAAVNLRSPPLQAQVTWSFPAPMFLVCMKNLVGEPLGETSAETSDESSDAVSDELRDGASELLNIAVGSAKKTLQMAGISFERALPDLLSGEQTRQAWVENGHSLFAIFSCDAGEFEIKFETKK